MIRTAIIIGFGEVGKAHWEVLKKAYPGKVFYKDIGPEVYDTNGSVVKDIPMFIDLMMIATQCDPNNMSPFYGMIREYSGNTFHPHRIDILTTTPCGACEKIQGIVGDRPVTKSTIRGMHPCLDKFLLDIPKHIGGPKAEELKEYYEGAGMTCICHMKARATELFHALNNSDYGVAILKAKENYDLCRHFGVDYMEYLEYKKSNNEGFLRAGFPSKVSPILTPPDNRIGGHCIVYSANSFPRYIQGPLMRELAEYNNKHNQPIKSDKN
jgi:hypothetical protein